MLQQRKVKARTSRRSEQTNKREAPRLPNTIDWSGLEEWQKDNDCITTGYRRWKGCLFSIFGYLHNETVNIHSHLLGAIVFLYFLLTFPSTIFEHQRTTWKDFVVFAVFLSTAVFCFYSSAQYHVSTAHSKTVANRCQAFDYTGIVVLIVGSFYPCIFYGYYAEPFFQVLYLVILSAAGIGAACIVLSPDFSKSSHRGARTAVFVGLGLCGIIPVTHLCCSLGFGTLMSDMGFGWVAISGMLYVLGALIYANRFPERLYPGKFDYFFASHQIFHMFCLSAALVHYLAILTAFDHRYRRV